MTAMGFVHEFPAQRVVLAAGAAVRAVVEQLQQLGASRVMLIAGDRVADLARGVAEAGVPIALSWAEVARHVPVELAEEARSAAREADVDAIVSIGGGSSTGLAKAIAMVRPVPILAVPTTYAGSEATNVWGLTTGGAKTTGVLDAVLPRVIVYDAALVARLPRELAVASGLNALAHGVDAMWGPRTDPIDRALAGEGVRTVAAGLRAGVTDPEDLVAREQTLYGAWLSAAAFACAGSGMHHKICHVLGGMFDLPHAETHAVVLPHVLAFNAPNAPEAEQRVATALGSSTAVEGLASLLRDLDAPRRLRDYGMPEHGIEAAIEPILAAVPDDNPTPLDSEGLRHLLRAAWGSGSDG